MQTSSVPGIIRGLLWINLAAGFILYVTYYHQLQGALIILRNSIPPLIFTCGMILAYSHDRSIIRRRRNYGEEREVIVVTYWDALLSDVLAFLTAIAIVLLPVLLNERGLDVVDLLQAALALGAMTYLRNYYWGKAGR